MSNNYDELSDASVESIIVFSADIMGRTQEGSVEWEIAHHNWKNAMGVILQREGFTRTDLERMGKLMGET